MNTDDRSNSLTGLQAHDRSNPQSQLHSVPFIHQASISPPNGSRPAFSRTTSYSPENPSHTPESVQMSNYSSDHSQNPPKRQKSMVYACDACAIKKVKCDTSRPCKHCVANKIPCTMVRRRKKSGPKNFVHRTMDCISNLNEVIDINRKKTEKAEYNVSPVPTPALAEAESESQGEEPRFRITSEPHDYKPTPANLIENIALIAEEPIILELMKPLTVQSLLINHSELVDFLNSNFKDKVNSLETEINLLEHHDDSVFLSKLLLVLTINLIIAEMLIKLKKQKFRDFIKYPKKHLFSRNFKNFKNLCHFKCMEINTLIEKNFLVPPIIPQNNPKNIKNINSNHLNQYQIYYNLSLSSLHLCNYYHILNLTNTLNSSSNLDNNFGNEAQEHHKLMNLKKAVSYYQLINLKTSDNAVIIQLYELFEILFTYERFYLIYSSNNYNLNLIRNNDILIQLSSKKILKHMISKINNSFSSNVLFGLVQIVHHEDELHPNTFSRLCKYTNFNIKPRLLDDEPQELGNIQTATDIATEFTIQGGLIAPSDQMTSKAMSPGNPEQYYTLKQEILRISNNDSIFDIIKSILIFKLWLINPLTFIDSKNELFFLVKYLNFHLDKSDTDLFKVQMSNYQLLQPLLHLLRIILEMREQNRQEQAESRVPKHNIVEFEQFNYLPSDDDNELLISFSDNLIKQFPFFNNINKLIRATKSLSTWFVSLNENRKKLDSAKKSTDQPSGSMVENYDIMTDLEPRLNVVPQDFSMRANEQNPELESFYHGNEEEYFSITPKVQHGPIPGRVNSNEKMSKGTFSSPSSGPSSGASSVISGQIDDKNPPRQTAVFPQNQDVQPQIQVQIQPVDQTSQFHSANQMHPQISQPFVHNAYPLNQPFPQNNVSQEQIELKGDNHNEFNSLSMSESTKNLYNLFNQISDDFMHSTSASMTNLFQLETNFTGVSGNTPIPNDHPKTNDI